MDWIALDRHWIGTGSALDQHWIHEILAAAGRAADWIGTGSVLDRYWIGTGSLLDRTGSDWIGLDRIGSDWILNPVPWKTPLFTLQLKHEGAAPQASRKNRKQ